ncbi:MAG TPA: type II secretion system protein GspG [Xanthomonadaceae bacterium]|jgi:general secretion pathway protein G|nr:type II secretion system protein GspG [Xanthomonadaceae bacterium]
MRKRFPGVARRRHSGFSLMEILIVVGIIAAIVAFAASQIFGGRDQANVRLAATQLESLAAKVEQFRMDTGQLPANLDALVTNPGASGWLGPYVRDVKDLNDPWGRPVQLRAPGARGEFELVSLGGDGQPGGESTDADIVKP